MVRQPEKELRHLPSWRLRVEGLISLIGMLAVNTSGFVDHATHSGHGCGVDWPLCHGSVVPVLKHTAVAIEYGHRMLTLGFVVVLSAFLLGLWRQSRDDRPGLIRWIGVELLLLMVEVLICTLGVLTTVPGPVMALLSPIGLGAQGVLVALVWAAWHWETKRPGLGNSRRDIPLVGITAGALITYLYAGGWLSYHPTPSGLLFVQVAGAALGTATVIGFLRARHRGAVTNASWSMLVWIGAPWLTQFAQTTIVGEVAMVMWLSWGTAALAVIASMQAAPSITTADRSRRKRGPVRRANVIDSTPHA